MKNIKVSESIFSGKKHIIPMADVSHIEKHWFSGDEKTQENLKGYSIIMKQTTWNDELGYHNNNPYLTKDEGKEFLKAWCLYRHELEEIDFDHDIELIHGTKESLAKLKL